MERYDIICGDMWRSKNGDYVRYLEAHAEIERLTKERDEALAQVAMAWIAVGAGKGGCGLPCGYDCNGACFALPTDAKAALEAYGREKVREGMKRAATICDSYCAEHWETGGLDHLLAARDAILAAMEKEAGK